MPISSRAAAQPRGFAPLNAFVELLRAISHNACWSSNVFRTSGRTRLCAIWMLAPTHHSKVCCGTKSPSWYRLSAKAVGGGGVGVAVGEGDGVGEEGRVGAT